MIEIEIPFQKIAATESNYIFALPPKPGDKYKRVLWIPVARCQQINRQTFKIWVYLNEWADNNFTLIVSPEARLKDPTRDSVRIRSLCDQYKLASAAA